MSAIPEYMAETAIALFPIIVIFFSVSAFFNKDEPPQSCQNTVWHSLYICGACAFSYRSKCRLFFPWSAVRRSNRFVGCKVFVNSAVGTAWLVYYIRRAGGSRAGKINRDGKCGSYTRTGDKTQSVRCYCCRNGNLSFACADGNVDFVVSCSRLYYCDCAVLLCPGYIYGHCL